MDSLTEYIKKAFDYKNAGDYKNAMDYFYKALAVENNSVEIMNELASLYALLCQYDRAVSLYEQILAKDSACYSSKFAYALLCRKMNDKQKAKDLLLQLYADNYEILKVAEELFPLLLEFDEQEKVISLFKSAKEEINSSSVLYFVGVAYSKMSCSDLSEEYFKKSFSVNEDNIDSGYNLAKILFDRKLYPECEKLLLRLLKYCEDDRVFALLAELSYANKKLEDSIRYYSYAIKLNSRVAEYFYKLGVLYSLKGFVNEAEQNYCKAVSIEPENILYNYTLAYLYYTNGKFALAENLSDYILTLDKENVSALALKILLLINNNELALAKVLVEKISASKQKDDFAFYAQSLYYSRLNLWEKAIECISKAIEKNIESIDYKYELAKNYFFFGKTQEALGVCDEILKINNKYIQAYVLKAKIALDNGEVTLADELANYAMKLDMNMPEIHLIKGIVAYFSQNYESALDMFKTAVSIKPDFELSYAWVAKSYFMLENYEDAYSYYKEAAELNMANAEYRYYMAKCSIFMNDKENALANFSVMKRLSPMNVDYIEEYAEYLAMNGNKKAALDTLKSTLKFMSNKEEKEKIKKIMKNL